jgi:hypothetical protein
MEEHDKMEPRDREEIFSKPVRAGKRTYFFDVKSTRSSDLYITITESKRRFSNDSGKFFYEKHKIFLYKEDFEKFSKGLADVIHFINTGEKPLPDPDDEVMAENGTYSDVEFDDLDKFNIDNSQH